MSLGTLRMKRVFYFLWLGLRSFSGRVKKERLYRVFSETMSRFKKDLKILLSQCQGKKTLANDII